MRRTTASKCRWEKGEGREYVKRKRDILFLCQFFYPEHNSSATLPFDTAKYLAVHGFTVDALCGYPKEYSDQAHAPLREEKDGVNIQRIRYIQLGRVTKLGRLINYFSFTASAFFHLFKLRRYKSVIVYSNPPVLPFVATLANKFFGTKLIFVAYDVYPEVAYASNTLRPGDLIDRVMKKLNHSIYKRASMVVSLTDEMKDFLLKNRPELTEDRVTTIANWAHEKKSAATPEAYERFGYTPDQFVVAYFGNMGICQEMETLLGAMRALKDNDKIRFLFGGHGNKKEQVEQVSKGMTNAQVIGFLTGEAFQQAVSIASCCVVSLEKGLMGMCAPSKYYSYLQGGKPILAVVEEGSYLKREVEQEKIGKAVSVGDVDALTEVLLSMSVNPVECKIMGERTAALYEREYTLDIGLGKYVNMFQSILRG